jgi:hypothetical protein
MGAMSDEKSLIPAQLGALAAEINAAHYACESALRTGLAYAVRAGELLSEARALCAHGEWLPWLREHFEGSERLARAYMRVAREFPRLEGQIGNGVADLSFREALAALAAPKESTDEPTGTETESVRAAAELVATIAESWWEMAEHTYEVTTGEDAVSLEQWCTDVSTKSGLPFSVGEAVLHRAAWVAYGSLPIEARPWPDDAAETMRRLGM